MAVGRVSISITWYLISRGALFFSPSEGPPTLSIILWIDILSRLIDLYILDQHPQKLRVEQSTSNHHPKPPTMKVITANFVTCAVKECKTSPASFPLHFQDAELEQQELDFQPEFIRNILPRIDWVALRTISNEVWRSKPGRQLPGYSVSTDNYNWADFCNFSLDSPAFRIRNPRARLSTTSRHWRTCTGCYLRRTS